MAKTLSRYGTFERGLAACSRGDCTALASHVVTMTTKERDVVEVFTCSIHLDLLKTVVTKELKGDIHLVVRSIADWLRSTQTALPS